MFVATLSANDHTIGLSIPVQCNTWHSNKNGLPHTSTFPQGRLFMGDDTVLEAIGKGSIKATMQVGGQLTHTTITQIFHLPKMKNNFISMSKLISEGFKVEFDKDGYKVNNAWKIIVAQAWRNKTLYLLNVKVRKDMAHIANSLEESAMLWHEKFGHLSMASLKE